MAEFFPFHSLINILLERLAPQDAILKYFRGKKDFFNQIQKLESTSSGEPPLEYYAERLLTHKEVKVWLVELNEVYTKVAYLLDDVDYHRQPKMEDESATGFRKYANFFWRTFVSSFERDAIDDIDRIVGMVSSLSNQQNLLGLQPGFGTKSFQKFPPPLVVKNSDVYGREDEKDKILKLLSNDVSAQEPPVICILGMCGVGKTTLAQLVYNNNSVRDNFKCRAWVVINEEFDFLKIVKRMLEKVTGNQPTTEDDSHKLQCALVQALKGKKFLFVLDNFWLESLRFWDYMKNVFKSGAPGSKIIVTTCSEIAYSKMGNAAMHELHLISDEDCLKIFAKDVFNEHVDLDMYPELKETGMKIVKKCKGLPLAVKSLAGVMNPVSNLRSIRQTQQEWEKKLESDIWQLMFEENLQSKNLPDLWPSYQELSRELRKCLAYCSIFPKGHEFHESDREKIILLWMAQGLLEPEKGKRMEDVEKEYLEALISKSFFQNSSQRGKQDFVMHDLVHDLAMRVSLEFCSYCGDSNDLSKLGTKSCHLSYRKGSDVLKELARLREPESSLRTLLALPLSSNSGGNNQVLEKSTLADLFQKGKYLKILSLSGSSAAEIPESIAKVKYLRYIDFSDTQLKRLPDSICELLKLQTLILSGCEKLEELPSRLAALVNLFHLDIRGTSSLKEMPPQMGQMKNLHRLSDFVLGERGGSRIKELAELKFLGGSLCIRGLENIVHVSDVVAAKLKDKKFLTELILMWKSGSDEHTSHQKVLNALEPHSYLKQLTIDGYRGTNFPDWVGLAATSNMEEVRLFKCKNCVTLPSFQEESLLKRLDIIYCEKLWENRMNWDLHKLSRLESLCLWGIREKVDLFPEEGLLPTTLMNLCIRDFEKLEGLNGRAFQHLTSLQQLEISSCNALKGLTEEVLPISLSHLCICNCHLELKQGCQRETGKDWLKIEHIKKIEIDNQLI